MWNDGNWQAQNEFTEALYAKTGDQSPSAAGFLRKPLF